MIEYKEFQNYVYKNCFHKDILLVPSPLIFYYIQKNLIATDINY